MDEMRQSECTDLDVHALSYTLSIADRNELMALGVLGPDDAIYDCLERCVSNSLKTYAIRLRGATLAIGGYTEHGHCWFLSSKHLSNMNASERSAFRKQLMSNLLDTLKIFPKLSNMAWSKNEQHLRLIKSCGGRIGTSVILPTGAEFTYFEFRREDYPQLN